MKLRPRPRAVSGFPLEALADVAFLLLGATVAVGLLTAPRGFALERSAGELGSLPPLEKETVFVRMLPDGGLEVAGRPASLEELVGRVRSLSEPRREMVIVIQAADDAPYESVVSLCDALSRPEAWSGVRPPILSLPTHRQIAEYVRAYGLDPFEGPPPSR